MTDQRKHFYCVGLAKAGTHSLADMLAPVLRSAHEPEPEDLIPLLPDARRGALDAHQMRRFLVERDQRLELDFESSHLLGLLTPHLVDAFPDARFILLVRDCESWIDSMINDQLNLRSWDNYNRWLPVYDSYLRYRRQRFPREEGVLRRLRLYPLQSYVRSWCDQILRITESIPTERLLTIRTQALATSGDALAHFFDVSRGALALERSHAYKSPRKHDVLSQIGDEYVHGVIESQLGQLDDELLQRLR